MGYLDIKKKYGLETNDKDVTENKESGRKTYADIAKKHGISFDVDEEYINTFISDYNKFASADESSSYGTWKELGLGSRASTVRGWLYHNKKNLDETTYKSLSSAVDSMSRLNDYYSQFESEESYNVWYKKQKEQSAILGAEDFEEYYQKGKADDDNNDFIMEVFGTPVGESNYIEHYRKYYADQANYGAGKIGKNASFALAMTEDEVKIYDYFLGKEGKKRAQEYLDSIEDSVNQRVASGLYQNVDENKFLEMTFAVSAGLDQFISGVRNLDNFVMGTEADPTSAVQYASSMIREDQNGAWGVAYDLLNTTGNMLPSILVGTVTGGLGGAATMGVSAVGNGYAEMRNLGYDEWQSRGYGLLVGASEAVLQYALGGISKLGGKVSGNAVSKLVSKIDNAFARTAIKLGGNMVSEGLEEAIQTALDPAFKALMTGEEFESAEWDDILYSALLGALSAWVLEGVPTVAGTAMNSHNANKVYGADVQALVTESLEIDPDNTHAQRMQARLDNGKKVSGYQLNRLVEANEQALKTQDTANIKSAVESRLTELGEKGDVAKLAEIITKQTLGENLTLSEKSALKKSQFASRVSNELDPDNIQAGTHSSAWTNSIKTNSINDYLFGSRNKATDVDTQTPVQEVTPEVMKGEHKVSESGKTLYTNENGETEEVSIQKIVSTNGGIKVELDNGKTVNVKDLELSSDAEAMAYEMVTRMETNPETAQVIFEAVKASDATSSKALFIDVPTAYRYGKINYEAGLAKLSIPDAIKKLAFDRGKQDAMTSSHGEKKSAPKQTKKTNAKKGETKQYSKVIFEGFEYSEDSATDIQKASMKAIDALSKMSNFLEYHVYASVVENGKRVAIIDGKKRLAPNGYFKVGTNKVYVDINAGNKGEGLSLYTLGHEVTHPIAEWNWEDFKKLGDFLIENFGKNNVPVDDLINEKMKVVANSYKLDGQAVPSDEKLFMEAYEEVVADSMSSMFANPNAYVKLAEFKKQDKTLWQKFGDVIKAILDKLKSLLGVYDGVSYESKEAEYVAQFSKDVYDKLQDLYIKAFVGAEANYQAAQRDGTVNKHLKNRSISYNERAIESHKAKLEEQYSNDASIDLDTLMKRYDKIISIWKSLGGELDSKFLNEWNNKIGKDRAFTVFKAQSGYKYNVELSSMCKKGVPLFEAIDTIVKKEVMKELGTDVLGKAEKEILYDILKSHSFEIPCAICYVEQARQREGAIIDAFLNGKIEKDSKGKTKTFKLGWNEVLKSVEKEMKALGVDYTFQAVDRAIATDKYVPADISMDATTQEAFYNALKKVANKEITRYNKEEGKSRKLVNAVTPAAIKEVFKGTLPSNLKIFKVLFTDQSARFTIESDLLYASMTTHNLATAHNALYSLFNSQGGVSGYKTKQGTVVYWGDILGKTWKPSAVRDEGGIRNQSNSDFQMYTLLDQAQMYIDFSAKGYYLQAYTKVLSELKLFGLSRGKINASLIPAVYEYRNADGTIDIEATKENAGLDKNGDLMFDDIEGINHKEAFMLLEDAEYSKSIGGICIGYSDNHILKLLDDQRVQQIIGFHDKTDDPDKRYRGARYAKNYNGLNEAINKEGKTVHIGFNPYVRKAEKMFTFNAETETYTGEIEHNGKTYVADDIPKLAADLYLEMCEKKGYTPAYTDFDFHENYYKLLADFSLYDSQGHYAPHRKVAYNMPDKVPYHDINGKKQYMPTKDYIKAELEKELSVRDAISEALADESENGIIPQFKKRVNNERETLSEAAERMATISAEDYLKEKEQRPFVLVMSRTPQIILDSMKGSMDRGVLIRKDALYLAIRESGVQEGHYHGLGAKALADLPKYLEAPDVILATDDTSTKKESEKRRLVLTHIQSKNGQAIISVEFESPKDFEGEHDYYNIVITVFDLHEGYLKKLFRKFNATIKYEKEDLAQVNPQLYKWLRSINARSSDKIVPQDSEVVKKKFSEREIADISNNDYVKMYNHFGSTKNYDVAGYILGNGVMLDFSGKHWGDDYSKSRQVDHRDVQEVLNDRGNNGVNAMIDMIGNGNIRLMPEVGGINLAVKPNATQVSQLRGYINHFKGEIVVDIDKVGGDTIHSFSYTRGTSSSKILADIKAYFEEGVVPEQQAKDETDIRQFLYSERDSLGNELSKEQQEFFKDSAIKAVLDDGSIRISPDGALMPVYHGTNNGEFYEFDKKLSGSSNDAGWYGKGFYFAFRKGEAEYYGKRVLECYLNIKNPFIFNDEMQAYDGVTSGDILFDFASFVLNMAEKFPDIAKKLTVDVAEHSYEDSSEVTEKNFVDLAAELKEIYDSKRLSVVEVHDDVRGDHYEYRIDNDVENMDIPSDLKKVIQEQYINSAFWAEYLRKEGEITREQYEDILDAMDKYGERNFETVYLHSRFETKKRAEAHRLSAALQYLSEKKYSYLEQHIPEHYMTRIGNEFSAEIQRRGYDGVLQSLYGDEVVAFDSNQIKLTTNKTPTSNPDIRYQERDPDSISNRSLLANALESAAKEGEERNILRNYKTKLRLVEAEQAKLADVRGKAHDLRFKKGRTAEETKTLNGLDLEAKQIANRINTYDRELLKIEAMKPIKDVINREKKNAYKRAEQKGKEALKKQRERESATYKKLLAEHQESREKAIEGRHKTEMRHKIKKVVGDLNNLLLHPTKDKHVPIGLQLVVADALDAINMDTMNAAERVAYYNDRIAKSSTPDEIEMLTKKRDFFEYRDMNFKDKVTALKNAYAEFKNSDDPLIRNAHNEAIADFIENTSDLVGKKSLKEMSYEQLEAVYNMYKAVLATVRNANKMFKEGRQETITENSEAVKEEVRKAGGHRDRVLKATKFLKKFGWDMLKPVTAMKVIGSDTLASLFDNVRAGEDTWAVDVSEAKAYYEEVSTKYRYKDWDLKKHYSFKDSAGHDFSLSLEQIMSLYAYSKREQADKHLEFGGFIFDDAIEVTEKTKIGIPMKYEVNDANPYRLRRKDLNIVIDSLTAEQKGFVDEMQSYLSDVMGAKGNEVSLAMYDIKLYNEKNYFPLKTSRYFREFDPEKSATPKIKNAGFSKKTVPQAGNPIVLSNFMDVWANHVNDMSMYHAFVLPLEDFTRVYNYSSTAGGYDSVQQYIKNAYGAQANQYVEKLLDDLNGGARVDSSAGVINKGLSLFKKASVFASASVVVQQPSAIARAFAYINPKYFAAATGSALNLAKHKELWAEVKKYAPVAIIKEMGYFDTGIGRSSVDWIKGNQTIMDKVDDALSKAPAIADELAWSHIWAAVKREVKATTNLKEGSEEFLKKAGARFTEVIVNTQVYDSVLSRSGMMRSKDTGMKMATAFMAEPTTTANMMIDGIIQGKRGNKKFLAATVGGVSASIVLNSILVALVYAARDDDEDETYVEKYLGSITSELLDGFNPLTYIPFVKDIWSIAQGYDVERSDMTVVSNLWESIERMFNEDTSGWEKVADVSGAVASLFGIPLKNIIRDAKGLYNLFETVTSGIPTTEAGIADSVEDAFKSSIPLWDRFHESETNADKLYEAIMSGDQAQIDRIKGRFKDEDAVEAAVRKGAKEAYVKGDLSRSEAEKMLISHGNLDGDEAYWKLKEWDYLKQNGTDEGYSKYNDFYEAVQTGRNLKAVISEYTSHGVEAKTLASQITSYFKPLYKEMSNAERASIKGYLLNAYVQLGYSRAEKSKDINAWLKD